MSAHRLLLGALALSLFFGCYTGVDASTDSTPPDPRTALQGGATDAAAPQGGGGGSGTSGGPTGLPCEVEQLLLARCVSCHASPPIGGAPMALLTYDDLTGPAKSDATKSVAQLAVERMSSSTRPMPPGAPSPAAEVATIQSWIAAGYPRGSCGGADAGAGAGDGGAAPNPYGTATICTSGAHWTQGDQDSSRMHPGGACIACHSAQGGPGTVLGGTVFPTAHEPLDCNGFGGSAVVEVTDAMGRVISMTVNASGNFFTTTTIAMPFRAKVIANGKERVMSSPQTSGDCNSCHTESGTNGAPGRIMVP